MPTSGRSSARAGCTSPSDTSASTRISSAGRRGWRFPSSRSLTSPRRRPLSSFPTLFRSVFIGNISGEKGGSCQPRSYRIQWFLERIQIFSGSSLGALCCLNSLKLPFWRFPAPKIDFQLGFGLFFFSISVCGFRMSHKFLSSGKSGEILKI